jgi:hypothetical protein
MQRIEPGLDLVDLAHGRMRHDAINPLSAAAKSYRSGRVRDPIGAEPPVPVATCEGIAMDWAMA